jgi:hypothetical protein
VITIASRSVVWAVSAREAVTTTGVGIAADDRSGLGGLRVLLGLRRERGEPQEGGQGVRFIAVSFANVQRASPQAAW